MNKNLKTISFAFAMFAVVGMISSTSVAFADDDETELEAKLVENGIEILEASFEIEDGVEELEVEVEGQTPGLLCTASHFTAEPLPDGTTTDLGSFTIDDEGEGELELVPSPLTVIVGDTITVVCNGNEFSGTFALEADDEEDHEDDDDDDEEIEIQSSKKIKSNNRRA